MNYDVTLNNGAVVKWKQGMRLLDFAKLNPTLSAEVAREALVECQRIHAGNVQGELGNAKADKAMERATYKGGKWHVTATLTFNREAQKTEKDKSLVHRAMVERNIASEKFAMKAKEFLNS